MSVYTTICTAALLPMYIYTFVNAKKCAASKYKKYLELPYKQFIIGDNGAGTNRE